MLATFIISTLVLASIVEAWLGVNKAAALIEEESRKVSSLCRGQAAFRLEGGTKYLNLYSLLMVDWDPQPTEGVYDTNHYTVSSIQEVEYILTQRVALHPDELWKAYITPSGGVHAFLVSHTTSMRDGISIIASMRGDLLYAQLSQSKGFYGVRVSPKMVGSKPRQGDFVAKAWKSFGNGIPLPENVITMEVHDSYLPI